MTLQIVLQPGEIFLTEEEMKLITVSVADVVRITGRGRTTIQRRIDDKKISLVNGRVTLYDAILEKRRKELE